MSHYHKQKMNLDCSLDVLRRALIDIMPQWEGKIKTDEEGNLGLQAFYSSESVSSGMNLVVPKSAGGIFADVGFYQSGGQWEAKIDDYSQNKRLDNLGNRLRTAVQKLRIQHRLQQLENAGYNVENGFSSSMPDEGVDKARVKVDVNKLKQTMAALQ